MLVGGMTFPWAVGQVSQQISVRSGMVVPGLGAIGIVSLCIALAFGERRSKALPTAR
jgi:hypothetical protein